MNTYIIELTESHRNAAVSFLAKLQMGDFLAFDVETAVAVHQLYKQLKTAPSLEARDGKKKG